MSYVTLGKLLDLGLSLFFGKMVRRPPASGKCWEDTVKPPMDRAWQSHVGASSEIALSTSHPGHVS